MSHLPINPRQRQLAQLGLNGIPALFLDAGEEACWKFIEFFTARIRNLNTRLAYGRAVGRFARWCDRHRVTLHQINPFLIALYIEDLGKHLSAPSVKQHLAAIRMLFDFLVVGQIVRLNPASSVRGPKHVVKKGKTPVLSAEEARQLFDSIETDTLAGLRDRALIGVMVYSFARVGAAIGMNVEDYYAQGKQMWFRLHEKGGKRHDVPAHHKAEEYMDAYLAATGIGTEKKGPLFRTLNRRRQITDRRIGRREVLAMVKRRLKKAGLPSSICNHSFRATGITTYLLNGGTLEHAQRLAAHSSPRTTKLYDRTNDVISLDEVERIIL